MLLAYDNKYPVVGANVFIAPTAVIIGDVTLHDNASVWFNAVLRGDTEPIVIGAGSNIQDNCTLHTDPGAPLTIGRNVTVGHNAVVHGCTVEDRVLIGMHACVLNHAVVKTGSIIAAGAVVRERQSVGPLQLAAGIPSQVKKALNEQDLILIDLSAEHYIERGKRYSQEINT